MNHPLRLKRAALSLPIAAAADSVFMAALRTCAVERAFARAYVSCADKGQP
ncbi:MAG: hypothetical protein AB7T59_17750 [Hyphomonadaceae bacterium]